MVVGGCTRSVFYLLGWLIGCNAKRARGCHAGAVSAVLWACNVDPEVFIAAVIATPTLASALETTLPTNAHQLCNNRVVIGACTLGWARRGPVVKVGRWSSKRSVIQTVLDAVTPHPRLNVMHHGLCSAANAPDVYRMCSNAVIVECAPSPAPSLLRMRLDAAQCATWLRDGVDGGAGSI